MNSSAWDIIVPVFTAFIAAVALIWTAYINRGNKPVREILKKTKVNGQGSLVEALGVLRDDLRRAADQRKIDADYFESIIAGLRKDLSDRDDIIDAQDVRITAIKKESEYQIEELKRRLREAGIDHE